MDIPTIEDLLKDSMPMHSAKTVNGLNIEIYHENDSTYGGFIDERGTTLMATWRKDGSVVSVSLHSFERDDAARYFNFSPINLEIHNLLNLMIMAGDHNDFANRLVKSVASTILIAIRDNPSVSTPDYAIKSIISLLQDDPFHQSVQYYIERLKYLDQRVADFDFPELKSKFREIGKLIGNERLDEELIGTPSVYAGYEIDMTSLRTPGVLPDLQKIQSLIDTSDMSKLSDLLYQ